MFFQDARKVTAFDVAFSYLSLLATGSFQGASASPLTGITILGQTQFDINVKAAGPFTLTDLTGLTVLPGRYWTSASRLSWDAGISQCTSASATCYPSQYTLGSPSAVSGVPQVICALSCTFPIANVNVDPAKITPTFDPLQAGILIGSGPWECASATTLGGPCSSTGLQNPGPGGSYTLARFGKYGGPPASSVSNLYSRSSGNLALWIWSQDNGDITHDFLNFSVIASCFGVIGILGDRCFHWEAGIGGCGGPPCVIGLNQIAIVNRFAGLNWIAPYNWISSPPTGIAALAPVLYEGSYTMNPASLVGCVSPYPAGGYDC